MLSALLAAVQTLTRIPVPSPRRPSDPTTIARSAVFYPLVGAAVNVLCRQYEIDPVVVDMGVNHTFDSSRAIVDRKIGFGTRNLLHEPAMNRREAVQSVETGVSLAEAAVKLDYGILAMGEMGIANTTPASAIVAVLARPLLSLDMRLGEGTEAALAVGVLEAALRLYREMATFESAAVSKRGPSA